MEGQANMLVPTAMIGWVPFTFMLFFLLPSRRAVLDHGVPAAYS